MSIDNLDEHDDRPDPDDIDACDPADDEPDDGHRLRSALDGALDRYYAANPDDRRIPIELLCQRVGPFAPWPGDENDDDEPDDERERGWEPTPEQLALKVGDEADYFGADGREYSGRVYREPYRNGGGMSWRVMLSLPWDSSAEVELRHVRPVRKAEPAKPAPPAIQNRTALHSNGDGLIVHAGGDDPQIDHVTAAELVEMVREHRTRKQVRGWAFKVGTPKPATQPDPPVDASAKFTVDAMAKCVKRTLRKRWEAAEEKRENFKANGLDYASADEATKRDELAAAYRQIFGVEIDGKETTT